MGTKWESKRQIAAVTLAEFKKPVFSMNVTFTAKYVKVTRESPPSSSCRGLRILPYGAQNQANGRATQPVPLHPLLGEFTPAGSVPLPKSCQAKACCFTAL